MKFQHPKNQIKRTGLISLAIAVGFISLGLNSERLLANLADLSDELGLQVFNEGTEHEYILLEFTEPETSPDLSKSSIRESVQGSVAIGDTVQYTLRLVNSGNADAHDVDVLSEVAPGFGIPLSLYSNDCGRDISYTLEEGGVELSNVSVEKGSSCTISYDVIVREDLGMLTNTLFISPSAEGGEELGPFQSKAISVGGSYSAPADEQTPAESVPEADEADSNVLTEDELIEQDFEVIVEEADRIIAPPERIVSSDDEDEESNEAESSDAENLIIPAEPTFDDLIGAPIDVPQLPEYPILIFSEESASE